MFKMLRTVLSFSLIAITGYGCAATHSGHSGHHAHPASSDSGKITEALKPSGIHEDCFEMLPGEMLDYSFESTKTVKFNIHCHEGSDIIYNVIKNDITSDKGNFSPRIKQYYCLMWTNPHHEALTITYSYNVGKGQK